MPTSAMNNVQRQNSVEALEPRSRPRHRPPASVSVSERANRFHAFDNQTLGYQGARGLLRCAVTPTTVDRHRVPGGPMPTWSAARTMRAGGEGRGVHVDQQIMKGLR